MQTQPSSYTASTNALSPHLPTTPCWHSSPKHQNHTPTNYTSTIHQQGPPHCPLRHRHQYTNRHTTISTHKHKHYLHIQWSIIQISGTCLRTSSNESFHDTACVDIGHRMVGISKCYTFYSYDYFPTNLF